MTPTQFCWRAMTEADLPEALAIAEIVHPNYPEDPAVFAERLALYPPGCLVLMQGDRAIGYIVSHPWRYADPPALNSLLGALPCKPSTYYIHDIALLSAARGSGAAKAVIQLLIDHAEAEGFPNLSLTAVNDSAAFWRRQGFVPMPNPTLDAKLRSYDEAARFMVRQCGKTRAWEMAQ
jgi:ribosomal protein S18 acetylase RimI-like enzyme